MVWQCAKCNLGNNHDADHCHSCQGHWTEVWKHGKHRKTSRPRNPSRQRPKQPKSNSKHAEDKAAAEEPAWNVFPSRAPWIPTTPQSRLVDNKDPEVAAPDGKLPLPPPPSLPQPPVAPHPSPTALSEDEVKLLSHLRGFQQLQALPPDLLSQLQVLEAKEAEQSANRALSHGHINKLHKTKNQAVNLVKKIKALDEEWRKFVADVSERTAMHATLYRQHREELQQSLHEKLKDLETVKKEVNVASQTLLDSLQPVEYKEEPEDTEDAMARISAVMQEAAAVDCLEISDNELETDATMETATQAKSSQAPRPFGRAAGSPHKVATNILKDKQEKKKS
eukprot:Skav208503  [mRNA]  locus=scaffold1658:98643:99653:- [translate_table: standard]